jgi:hypothetical protein
LNGLEEALAVVRIVARTRTAGPAKNLTFHRLLQNSLPRHVLHFGDGFRAVISLMLTVI